MNEAAITEELFQLLNSRSYKEGDFTLASGRKSKHYFNGKKVLLERDGAQLFARWILGRMARIETKPVSIGGLELGAVPIACSVMTLSEGPLRSFIVRKQKKEHGVQQQIEGDLEPGEAVVVVDDVITTGGSTLQAIRAVEARGCTVVGTYCLVDRQEGTLPELEPYNVQAVFTLDEFLSRRSV
jgi:orotate phosphoribosyltransferase